jgi:tetratricopeptide (TPR) repeat protein
VIHKDAGGRLVTINHLLLVTTWACMISCCSGAEDPRLESGTTPGGWEEKLHIATEYSISANYEEARSVLLALIEEADKPGPARERSPILWNHLAILYLGMGHYLESEKLFQRALAAMPDTQIPEDLRFLVLNGLLLLYIDTCQFDKADGVAQRIAIALPKSTALRAEDIAQYRASLGQLYAAQRRYLEAEKLLVPAAEEAERNLGADHPVMIRLLQELGANAVVQGKWKDAIPYFERTLRISERIAGPEHPGTARQLNNLAIAYRHAGHIPEAERLSRQAVAIFESRLGPDHPYLADALRENAADLRKLKRAREARALERRARLILIKRDRDNLLGGTIDARELALRGSRD